MYKKVHLQLTCLFTGITAAIMIIMSLCYLYVSESGLFRNQYNSFKNDMNTIATNLEQMPVISFRLPLSIISSSLFLSKIVTLNFSIYMESGLPIKTAARHSSHLASKT